MRVGIKGRVVPVFQCRSARGRFSGYGGYAHVDVRESDGCYSCVYAVEYICVM